MRVLQNDPPRQRSEKLDYFVPLDRILAESDFITLHVPLTKSGPDKTFHLFDEATLRRLAQQPIFINSARGAAVDNSALLKALQSKQVSGAVLDVWEGEPNISRELLAVTDIATPHIAGYSFDGKVNGTVMIYRAACECFGIQPCWDPTPLMPTPAVDHLEADAGGRDGEDVLRELVSRIYDITLDDRSLRLRTQEFDRLRAGYLVRREFHNTNLVLQNASDELRKTCAVIGFHVK